MNPAISVPNLNFNDIITAAAAAKSLQLCLTLCDPMDCSSQAPPSMGFSRQEHWSGVPSPSPDIITPMIIL